MLPLFLLIHSMASRGRIFCRNTRPKKSFKIELGNATCRTCGCTGSLGSLFTEGGNHEKRSEELRIVTGLTIKYNDGLSQKICRRCYRFIKRSLRFRRVSKRTEKLRFGMRVKTENGPRLAMTTVVKTEPQSDNLQANDFGQMGFIDRYQNYNFPDLYDICKKEPEEVDPHNTTNDIVSFTCKTCGELFTSRNLYDSHRKTHNNLWVDENATPGIQKQIGANGMYKCHICGKEFRMRATYTSHLRFHTHYCVCEDCGKRCRNNNELQEHKRARHGLMKIHKCSHCEYSSATKEALTIHERHHTGERPYVCDHCGSSFFRRSTLVQHIAIHLPDKNFQCDMCPKWFKSKKFLQIHKHDAHTGKKYGYLCSVCNHRFEKPYIVRAHTRKVHGVPDEQQGSIVRIEL
ncbi:zinc finger protein 254-like [Danaus plexippus]|uniref:zinc finger protein 254-like n=1 Tax=Danaus plexippus TaxID=13037 RepID=UPI002AB0C7B6|nr:zinc finger protein 254-like [Danaus plexippus]